MFWVLCCCAELLALWPCQCSPSWKTTDWLLVCVCVCALEPYPTPGSFLQSVLCSVPAAPGAVRRRQPTKPTLILLALKELTLWDFSAGTMSCWIQTGFSEVSKDVRVPLNKQQISVETADLEWGQAPVGATLAAAELFGKVYLPLKCNSKILALIRHSHINRCIIICHLDLFDILLNK